MTESAMAGGNERIDVEGCDTIPKLFWHQVKKRGEWSTRPTSTRSRKRQRDERK